MLEKEAAELIRKRKIKLTASNYTNQGKKTYEFTCKGKGEEYKIRIWEELRNYYNEVGDKTTSQMIRRSNCTCKRGSLINLKYNTVCKHILAAEWILISQNLWKNDVTKQEK